MRSFIFGVALTCLFVWLGARFAAKAAKSDRRFIQVCVLWAFVLFAGLVIWSQYFVFQGEFAFGDGEGYHLAAILALDHFKEGQFFITGEMLRLNYPGYPAYFIAPLYALGGPEPVLVVLAQLILHLHIAIMIYQMTQSIEDRFPAGRYAFFFALFFPDSIAHSLYHLKDVLILWCIVVALLNSVLIVKFGVTWRYLLAVAIAASFLAILRIPSFLLALLAFAVALTERQLTFRNALIAKMLTLGLVAWLFWDLFDVSYAGVEGLMSRDRDQESFFSEAQSPLELVSVVVNSPLRGLRYALTIFQAVFTGGLAVVRRIGEIEYELSLLNVAYPIIAIGALWRWVNIPFTLYGLWVILKTCRRNTKPVLVFSGLLMATMFILGYSARWGLAGMIINCIAWGIGYSRRSRRQERPSALTLWRLRQSV